MKVSSIRIENFRSFRDETIPVNDYACFVGPNGAGKSNVLAALNVFFQNPTSCTPNVAALEEEDFFNKNLDDPIRITLTFEGFSENARVELKDYIRQDKLVVSLEAKWNSDLGQAPIRQYGQRSGIKDFAIFFALESDGAKVQELKDSYAKIKSTYAGLPSASTKAAMADALRAYETDHSELCELIPSHDQFYGSNKGKLNAFVQWVYVPAVKDASEEGEESKKSALGQLLARTVRATTDFGSKVAELKKQTFEQYEKLLEENQEVLSDVSGRLKTRLAEWSHTDTNFDLRWVSNKEKSVQVVEPVAGVFTGEGEFTGSLNRMGHGLQRSYLLALLTELATLDEGNAPTLILACEEPELYQHPPQARRLASVFQRLATAGSKILVTTHSPFFVSGEGLTDVRLVRKVACNGSRVSYSTARELADHINEHSKHREVLNPTGMRAKIHQSLQPHLNEMFFCRFPVFVEGLEDVAYINTALQLYGLWDEFHSLGCHLVPANGKNHLIHPVAIAKKFTIPFFLVFDCDGHEQNPANRKKHEQDNMTLLSLLGLDHSVAFPSGGLDTPNCRAWQNTMGETVESDFDHEDLMRYQQAARTANGNAKSLQKVSLYIGELLLAAFEDGKESATLKNLCHSIITAGKY
jgi:predicted ATPase